MAAGAIGALAGRQLTLGPGTEKVWALQHVHNIFAGAADLLDWALSHLLLCVVLQL